MRYQFHSDRRGIISRRKEHNFREQQVFSFDQPQPSNSARTDPPDNSKKTQRRKSQQTHSSRYTPTPPEFHQPNGAFNSQISIRVLRAARNSRRFINRLCSFPRSYARSTRTIAYTIFRFRFSVIYTYRSFLISERYKLREIAPSSFGMAFNSAEHLLRREDFRSIHGSVYI